MPVLAIPVALITSAVGLAGFLSAAVTGFLSTVITALLSTTIAGFISAVATGVTATGVGAIFAFFSSALSGFVSAVIATAITAISSGAAAVFLVPVTWVVTFVSGFVMGFTTLLVGLGTLTFVAMVLLATVTVFAAVAIVITGVILSLGVFGVAITAFAAYYWRNELWQLYQWLIALIQDALEQLEQTGLADLYHNLTAKLINFF